MEKGNIVLISQRVGKLYTFFEILFHLAFIGAILRILLNLNFQEPKEGLILFLISSIILIFFLFSLLNTLFRIGDLYLDITEKSFLIKRLFSKRELPIADLKKMEITAYTIILVFKNYEKFKFYDFNLYFKDAAVYGLLNKKKRKEKFLKKLENVEVYLNDECLK